MEQKDYRLAAIMYTDIVGFSRMMERDEAGTLKLLNFHNQLVMDICKKHNGSIIKTFGDAFLVDFKSTVNALQCAMKIQDVLYEYNIQHKESPLLLRIGIHLGDIYFYENDALGDGINIAVKLQSLAQPGTICISQDVYNQVLNKLEFQAEKLGKVSLKTITKEISAYEIVSENVVFNPNQNKPHTGYSTVEAEPPQTTTALQDQTLFPHNEAGETTEPIAPYTITDGKARLASIKEAIRQKSLSLPGRLTIEEALRRYGDGSIEVQEIIAELAQEGVLTRSFSVDQGTREASLVSSQDVASYIGKAVEDVVRTIETKVAEWQKTKLESDNAKRSTSQRELHQKTRARVNAFGISQLSEMPRMPRMPVNSDIPVEQLSKQEIKRRITTLIKEDSRELPTGNWDKELADSKYFSPGTEELENDFSAYKNRCEDKNTKTVGGFIGNFISFTAVNSFLWAFAYQKFTPGIVLWQAIVTAGWGTGLVSNFFSLVRSRAKIKELRKMPYLEDQALAQYKKLNRVRDSMASHTATAFTVPALIGIINWVVTPGLWWSIIPAGIIVLSFLGHLGVFPATVANIKRKICEKMGVSSWKELFTLPKRKPSRRNSTDMNYIESAETLKDDIVRLIDSNPTLFTDADLKPSLESYITQIKQLTASINEINSIVNSIPREDLAKDKAALMRKVETERNPLLKEEFKKSISEIEKQEHAVQELVDQNEILKLRIKSSVNTLHQFKLDMMRLKAMPDAETHTALETLRTKTYELTNYVSDIKAGYIESTKDPFAELERLAQEDATKKP